jgi:hypothetical protein
MGSVMTCIFRGKEGSIRFLTYSILYNSYVFKEERTVLYIINGAVAKGGLVMCNKCIVLRQYGYLRLKLQCT